MNQSVRKRQLAILFVLLACLFFLFLRLVYIQFCHPRNLGDTAKRQSKLLIEIPAVRGKILDRNGHILAMDVRTDSVGAHPREMTQKEAVAQKLKNILGMDIRFIRSRLARPKEFVWIARKISPEKSLMIQNLKNKNIEIRKEWKRYYPNGSAGCQVIGFTGLDHEGLEGVELLFDSYLKGVVGWKLTQKDALQREVVAKETEVTPPVDGYNIQLTADIVIQRLVDKLLAESCRKHNAQGGCVVVVDPANGDIIAMSNYPQYDPNRPGVSQSAERRNRCVTDMYEPGSVFKVFTLSAVLNEGVCRLSDRFDCEHGSAWLGGRRLHDVHPYGSLSLKEIIVNSSNIGTAKAATKLGMQKLYDNLKRFGFGEKTGINLEGEVSGLLRPVKLWSGMSLSSIAIGQEVGVTTLQMAYAYAAVSDGGLLMQPRIISNVVTVDGKTVREFPPAVKRRVITQDTARNVQETMIGVVKEGTGKKADVEGAIVGGKTGTARKIGPDGFYAPGHYFSSFGGFVARDKKRFVIMVSIDDPKPAYYGGTVAAPLFSKISGGILDYWLLDQSPKEESGFNEVS